MLQLLFFFFFSPVCIVLYTALQIKMKVNMLHIKICEFELRCISAFARKCLFLYYP